MIHMRCQQFYFLIICVSRYNVSRYNVFAFMIDFKQILARAKGELSFGLNYPGVV